MNKLFVKLIASQTRRRLKEFGYGVRNVESTDRNRAVILLTATGDHLRELEAILADVLPKQEDGSSDADMENDNGLV